MNYAVKTGLKARQKYCHQLFRFKCFLFVVMRHCSNCLETFKFFKLLLVDHRALGLKPVFDRKVWENQAHETQKIILHKVRFNPYKSD